MLKKNKDWLKTMNVKKNELSIEVMEIVSEALKYKYSLKASNQKTKNVFIHLNGYYIKYELLFRLGLCS